MPVESQNAEPVVLYEELEPGVIQLTMQDRVHKNTFSPALQQELIHSFEQVEAASDCKVVILTGYDSYFASGGTQEGLLAISEGQMSFTDTRLYGLALDCRVPVIAAMQGHGIGGGLVIGLSADFVILSRESVYTANFMKFGFTPGMGATCIIPRKLGMALGQELLMNGGTYRGGELERRGIPFPVYSRQEVLPKARELARQLAEKPRVSLMALKAHLTAELRSELPGVIEREVAMHEITFRQPEVKERIHTLFRN